MTDGPSEGAAGGSLDVVVRPVPVIDRPSERIDAVLRNRKPRGWSQSPALSARGHPACQEPELAVSEHPSGTSWFPCEKHSDGRPGAIQGPSGPWAGPDVRISLRPATGGQRRPTVWGSRAGGGHPRRAGGRPCARSSAAASPRSDHGPGRSMTASADVGIGTRATGQARHQVLDPRVVAHEDDGRHLPRNLPKDAEERSCRSGVHESVFSDRRRDVELRGGEPPGLTGALRGRDDGQVDDADVVGEPSAGLGHLTLSPSRQRSQVVRLAAGPVRLAVPQQDECAHV